MPSQGREIKTDVSIHLSRDEIDGGDSFFESDARYLSIRLASFAAQKPTRSVGKKLGAKMTSLTRQSS